MSHEVIWRRDKISKKRKFCPKCGEANKAKIGLATMKRIIARHNGEVRAESVINEGATLFVTLKLKKGDENDTENDSLS